MLPVCLNFCEKIASFLEDPIYSSRIGLLGKPWVSGIAVAAVMIHSLSAEANSTAIGSASNLKILILGDSPLHADDALYPQSLGAILERELASRGHSARVFNQTRPGASSRGCATRIKRYARLGIELAIIQLGNSDLRRRMNLQEIEKNLVACVESGMDQDLTMILLGSKTMDHPKQNGLDEIHFNLAKEFQLFHLPEVAQSVEPESSAPVTQKKLVKKLLPTVLLAIGSMQIQGDLASGTTKPQHVHDLIPR